MQFSRLFTPTCRKQSNYFMGHVDIGLLVHMTRGPLTVHRRLMRGFEFVCLGSPAKWRKLQKHGFKEIH